MSTKQILMLVVGGALVLLPEPLTTATGTTIGLAVLATAAGFGGIV